MERHITIKTELDFDEGYEGPMILELNEDAISDIEAVLAEDTPNGTNDNEQSVVATEHQVDQSSNKRRTRRYAKSCNKTLSKRDPTKKGNAQQNCNQNQKLKPGRKNLPRPKPVTDDARLKRICPMCSKRQLSTNLIRHLKGAHKIKSQKKLSDLSKRASLQMRSGPRSVDFNDLPKVLKLNWHKKNTKTETKRFFEKYQLYIAEDED